MKNSLVDFARLSFGNIIEWYDFSLYVYFADYIAYSFFPDSNHYVSMLLVFATFFLGSLVRPIGGLLVGWLGDRFDLKFIVNLCIIVMGLSTVLVAFLPDYSMVGIFAPILLVTLRIIQGISVGGQFPGLITLSVQDYNRNKGFAVSIVFSVSSLGFLLASLVGFSITEIITDHNSQLIWRIPFAFSGVLFLIYLFLNRGQKYTNSEKTSNKQSGDNVFKSLCRQWRSIVAVVCLCTMNASLYFIVFTYIVDYQVDVLGIADKTAFLINSVILFFACIMYPLFGYLADKLGLIKVFYFSAICLLLLSFPLIFLIQTKDILLMFASLFILTLFMTSIQGAISPLFAETFDEQWQTTGCAFSYSVGNGISGAAPLAAMFMVHIIPHFGLGILISALIILGIIGMLLIQFMKKQKKNCSNKV